MTDNLPSLIPLISVRLSLLAHSSNDRRQMIESTNLTIVTILHCHLNAIVTCLPFTKPVTENLRTGILVSRLPDTTVSTTPSYQMKLIDKLTGRHLMKDASRSQMAGPNKSQQGKLREDSQERMVIRHDLGSDVQSDLENTINV